MASTYLRDTQFVYWITSIVTLKYDARCSKHISSFLRLFPPNHVLFLTVAQTDVVKQVHVFCLYRYL